MLPETHAQSIRTMVVKSPRCEIMEIVSGRGLNVAAWYLLGLGNHFTAFTEKSLNENSESQNISNFFIQDGCKCVGC